MTLDEYVSHIEEKVNDDLIWEIRDWPVETKLYMYLHNIQLAHMEKFQKLLEESNARK